MIANKIKKVLIALDSGPTALKVAEAGFLMAKSMGAEVILLHVIINLVTYSMIFLKLDPLDVESLDDMKMSSKNFLEKSVNSYGSRIMQKVVKQGDFAVELIDAANNMTADIIIMGSQSSRWLEEIVMGRVTNELLQQTKIPILILPTKKNEKLFTYISLEH